MCAAKRRAYHACCDDFASRLEAHLLMASVRLGDIAYHPNPNPGRKIEDRLARACVYVPPVVTNRVLYLLHGVGDNEYSWELQAGVSSLLEELVSGNSVSPTIVAMPFGFVTQENKLNRRFPPQEEFDA